MVFADLLKTYKERVAVREDISCALKSLGYDSETGLTTDLCKCNISIGILLDSYKNVCDEITELEVREINVVPGNDLVTVKVEFPEEKNDNIIEITFPEEENEEGKDISQ